MILGKTMRAGHLRLEPMAEVHREALKAACAQDLDIWSIYSISYDPDRFDAAFDLIRSRPNWRCFSIFLGGDMAGMSCFLGIDPGRAVLEIGNTYYVPRLRGSGLNRRVITKYAAKLKFLLDESFDEGSHIDKLLRAPKVAQDLERDEH